MITVGVVVSAVLFTALVLVVLRIVKGPTTLDRIVAVDVLLAVVMCAIAAEAAYTRDATSLPVLVILSILGFIGSVSVARFRPQSSR